VGQLQWALFLVNCAPHNPPLGLPGALAGAADSFSAFLQEAEAWGQQISAAHSAEAVPEPWLASSSLSAVLAPGALEK